jgi:hypothetical protein
VTSGVTHIGASMLILSRTEHIKTYSTCLTVSMRDLHMQLTRINLGNILDEELRIGRREWWINSKVKIRKIRQN